MTTSDQLKRYEANLRVRTCAACLMLFDTLQNKHKHDREVHSGHARPPAYAGKVLNPMSERFEAKP